MENKNEKIKKAEVTLTVAERISAKITAGVGTPTSIVFHTIFFIGVFFLRNLGFELDQILLILTTAVSLEAIYLALFIQMTINRQEAKLHEVHEDIEELGEDVEEIGKDVDELGEDFDEIAEDIEELGEDVEEIGKDVDELSEDVEEIGKDVDELSEDVEEIGKDVDELGEDFEEITEDMEEDDKKEEAYRSERNRNLQKIETTLQALILELEKMKEEKK